jgi:hypothetical protein
VGCALGRHGDDLSFDSILEKYRLSRYERSGIDFVLSAQRKI